MNRIVAGFTLVFALACPAGAFADGWQADPLGRSKEQVRQDTRNRDNFVFAARMLCIAAGGVMVWIAISIARNGLGIGPRPQRITGTTARVFAAVLGALGIAVAIFGTIFVADLFGPA
jgi:hypothetical protein